LKSVKYRLTLIFFCVTLLPAVACAHTVAELSKDPASFDQQPVSVVGKVANLVTRYGDTPYTTFDVVDAKDSTLPVVILGKPTFRQGDFCHITGTFVQEKTVGTYVLTRGIEAEKVEKLANAEHKTAGQLFGRRPGTGRSPNKYPRGMYMPQ
jgi:hypothetical protein